MHGVVVASTLDKLFEVPDGAQKAFWVVFTTCSESYKNYRISRFRLVPLTTEEINRAKLRCFQPVQTESFSELRDVLSKGGELKANHPLYVLRPTWDDENHLIRVTGRLIYDLQNKTPSILLAKNHQFVKFLIQRTHSLLFHTHKRYS